MPYQFQSVIPEALNAGAQLYHTRAKRAEQQATLNNQLYRDWIHTALEAVRLGQFDLASQILNTKSHSPYYMYTFYGALTGGTNGRTTEESDKNKGGNNSAASDANKSGSNSTPGKAEASGNYSTSGAAVNPNPTTGSSPGVAGNLNSAPGSSHPPLQNLPPLVVTPYGIIPLFPLGGVGGNTAQKITDQRFFQVSPPYRQETGGTMDNRPHY